MAIPPTDIEIDEAVPPRGTDQPHEEQPNRILTNRVLKRLRDSVPEPAPVQSVFGRAGDVAPEAGDYAAGQVFNDSGIPGGNVAQSLQHLQSSKLDAADYNQHWLGLFASLAELQAAHPTARAGDYATVDPGAGDPPRKWLWDVDTSEWVPGSDAAPGSTDDLPEGSQNLYFTAGRAAAAAPVQSVHGRTGDVVGAAGDYDSGQVDNASSVAGDSVSDALETLDAEKLNASDYNDRWKGLFPTPEALRAAWPEAAAGDYATVDPGAGTPARKWLWDTDIDDWVAGSDTAPGSTDDLPEGAENLYFTPQRARNANVLAPRLDDSVVVTITQADSARTVYVEQEAAITPQAGLPNGFQCAVLSLTDDEVTLNPPAGAVLDGRDGPGIYRIIDRATYAALEKIADDLWIVSGNVELVP